MITVRLDLSVVLYIIYQFRAFVKTLKRIEEYARNIKSRIVITQNNELIFSISNVKNYITSFDFITAIFLQQSKALLRNFDWENNETIEVTI